MGGVYVVNLICFVIKVRMRKATQIKAQNKLKKNFMIHENIYWSEVKHSKETWKPGLIKRRIGNNLWQVLSGENS